MYKLINIGCIFGLFILLSLLYFMKVWLIYSLIILIIKLIMIFKILRIIIMGFFGLGKGIILLRIVKDFRFKYFLSGDFL